MIAVKVIFITNTHGTNLTKTILFLVMKQVAIGNAKGCISIVIQNIFFGAAVFLLPFVFSCVLCCFWLGGIPICG